MYSGSYDGFCARSLELRDAKMKCMDTGQGKAFLKGANGNIFEKRMRELTFDVKQ